MTLFVEMFPKIADAIMLLIALVQCIKAYRSGGIEPYLVWLVSLDLAANGTAWTTGQMQRIFLAALGIYAVCFAVSMWQSYRAANAKYEARMKEIDERFAARRREAMQQYIQQCYRDLGIDDEYIDSLRKNNDKHRYN